MDAIKLFLLVMSCILPSVLALQVTPNSQCAEICLDAPTQDASNPVVPNISGSEIVCKDSDYQNNTVGQKFESCINCLQNSTTTGSGHSDQAWFLYNLRFALNTCIFGTSNATDPESTPCSTDTSCGPLQGALLDGMQNPSTIHEYGYCSAYDNSFVGSFLPTCTACLRENKNELYLANFLVALDAGCIQRAPAGSLIGLNGTLFSEDQVAITFSMTSPAGMAKHHKTLSSGAIIGIAVACAVVVIAIIAIIFIRARMLLNAKRLKELQSPLDSRFGAMNISAPYSNGYASPDSPPLVKEAIPMTESQKAGEGHDPQIPYSPPSSGGTIPAHHAYLPPQYTPRSRTSLSPVHRSSKSSSQPLPPAPYPQRSPSSNGSTAVPSSVTSPVSILSRTSSRGTGPSLPPRPSPHQPSPSQFSLGRDLTAGRENAGSSRQISGPMTNVGRRPEGLGLSIPSQPRVEKRSPVKNSPDWKRLSDSDSDNLW